jgi:methanogenesis marker radical SAM protein
MLKRMQYLDIDVGGRPGADCHGFCEYCYFRHIHPAKSTVDPLFRLPHVPPPYLPEKVKTRKEKFRDYRVVAVEAVARYLGRSRDIRGLQLTGGGDLSCYPHLVDLVAIFGTLGIPTAIGYSSGKGFGDPAIGKSLVKSGLSDIGFSVFSVDPDRRKKFMHDPHPEISLSVLEYLCGEIDVYAAAVVVPGMNDGEYLVKTCEWLEERGAKGLILMRFANTEEQGLILGNSPIIRGQQVQSIAEFHDLVKNLSPVFKMKINGSPLSDTEFGSPFAIRNNPGLISRLPRVMKRATIVTGSIAAPSIQMILDRCGFHSTVTATKKEIACLITLRDLEELDHSSLEKTVILPGRALVRDTDAQTVLSADGIRRTVVRGPDVLTADAERSMGMTCGDVEDLELTGFTDLINAINHYGV